jgi:hypothetical protein
MNGDTSLQKNTDWMLGFVGRDSEGLGGCVEAENQSSEVGISYSSWSCSVLTHDE